MKKSNTSKRLKEIMRTRGMRQVDILNTIKPIAEETGVRFEKNDLSQYVSGKVEPSQQKLTVLSKALGVSETWLMGYDDLDAIINFHPDLHPIRKIKPIPILGTIACGTPIWAEQNFEGYVGLDPQHMDGDFALYCKGDSMVDAEIYDGDLVLLKKTPEIENGKIAAVLIDDEATLKKVYIKDDTLLLQPCNNNYSPLIYKKEDLDQGEVMILGECIGVYHTVG